MDFSSLLRRDLQFLCKKNKIPANMTNVAMADALKALEIVEGLDEYMNQSNSNAPQSPSSVAKLPSNTAARTTRRKTTVKAEPQSSSQLVTRACRTTSKSLAGDLDQENINKNFVPESKANNVPKTPAARTTRKASATTSCSSKVQESKKDELVQSVYSTRRSTRLLEKCMADLSLKTKDTLEKPAQIEETEQKVSAQEKNPVGSEAEVIPGRDLNASMEQVWENLKNDNDQVAGDLEIYVDLGDIAVSDANTETTEEKMNEVACDEKESDNSLVQVDKQEEIEVAIYQENDSDAGDSETEPGEDDSGVDSDGTFSEADSSQAVFGSDFADEEMTLSESEGSAAAAPTSPPLLEEAEVKTSHLSPFAAESISRASKPTEASAAAPTSPPLLEEAEVKTTPLSPFAAESISRASKPTEACAAAPTSPPLLEDAEVKTTPLSPFAAESISVQFPRPSKPTTTPLKNSALKLVNENKENNMEMMMNVNNNENGESKGEEGKKKKKVTIDEENLKDVSMRQLVKMVKELSIKSSNRTALQTLPANNQTAE